MSQTAISSTSKRSKRSRSTVLVIGILSLANNKSDWWIITFTPFSSDQMIRNLSMKIGEVDSGSARLLCAASNLADTAWHELDLVSQYMFPQI